MKQVALNAVSKILGIIGILWCLAMGVLIMASLGMLAYNDGFWAVAKILSPFNVKNYIVTIISLSPGILCLMGAEKMKARSL